MSAILPASLQGPPLGKYILLKDINPFLQAQASPRSRAGACQGGVLPAGALSACSMQVQRSSHSWLSLWSPSTPAACLPACLPDSHQHFAQ